MTTIMTIKIVTSTHVTTMTIKIATSTYVTSEGTLSLGQSTGLLPPSSSLKVCSHYNELRSVLRIKCLPSRYDRKCLMNVTMCSQ